MSRKTARKKDPSGFGISYDAPVIVDVETSGLDYRTHEIIQLAAYAPVSGESFEIKIKFSKKKADPKALEINHYSKKKWKKAVEKKEAAELFNSFLKRNLSCRKKAKTSSREYEVAVLAGYNISAFDKDFLIQLFQDEGKPAFAFFDYRTLDVYELVKWLYPRRELYKLADLCESLNIEIEKTHDALSDVMCTTELMAICIDQLPGKSPNWTKKYTEIPF